MLQHRISFLLHKKSLVLQHNNFEDLQDLVAHSMLLNNTRKCWKLVRKEESRPHKSRAPESIKSNEIRARGSFRAALFNSRVHTEQIILGIEI